MTKKSPLKWVGGKYRQKDIIINALNLPSKPYVYAEPFLGSGEVYYSLPVRPERAYLADSCGPLMNFHKSLNNKQELVEKFKEYCEIYPAYKGKKYYKLRDKLNKSLIKPSNSYILEQAAMLYYINKFGFNGLYRVNKSGKVNTPIGSACESKESFDKAARAAIKALESFFQVSDDVHYHDSFFSLLLNLNYRSNAVLSTGKLAKFLDKDLPVVMYVDPPYYQTFSSYGVGWSDSASEILISIMENIALPSGSIIVMSNSVAALELINESKWKIERVSRAGTMSSDTENRGRVEELLLIRSF
jgi:DNA adenine methylase Dam